MNNEKLTGGNEQAATEAEEILGAEPDFAEHMERMKQEQEQEELDDHEKTKCEHIIETCKYLFSEDEDKQQKFLANLKMYRDAGRASRTSIFHENIEEAHNLMMITDEVYAKMKQISEVTASTKKEHAFLSFGRIENGCYFFNSIVSDVDLDEKYQEDFYNCYPDYKTEDTAVDYHIVLMAYRQYIDNHIGNMSESGKKPLISLGHTHPNASESYGNYSLPDLVNLSQYERAIRGNHDASELEQCHIILPENGDVDCVIFDKNKKRFEKIVNVFSINQDGEQEVPAYTFKSPTKLSETNIVKEKYEDEDDKIYSKAIDDFLGMHTV